MSTVPSSTSCCRSGATRLRVNAASSARCAPARPHAGVLPAGCAATLRPSLRHRSWPTRSMHSSKPAPGQQPRREQPSAHSRTRTAHTRLPRPKTHAGVLLVLRLDPPPLCPQAASAARFALPQIPRRPLLGLACIRRSQQKTVYRFLSSRFIKRRFVPISLT